MESLLIVLSSDNEIYRSLAKQIRTQCAPASSEILVDRANLAQLLTQPEHARAGIVALGAEAAQAALPFTKTHLVVFSLVYNYRSLGLLEGGMVGVSMLPEPGQVLKLLQEINPKITKVAMPTGPGMEDYTVLARRAAEKLGLNLLTPEVASNKELLHFINRLDRQVGGFWLLPDNRILSRETIQQVVSANVKAGRSNVVFSPELFRLGGLISARYSGDAIAGQIRSVVKGSAREQSRFRGTVVQPPAGIINIHEPVVKTLGLKVPAIRQNLIWSGS